MENSIMKYLGVVLCAFIMFLFSCKKDNSITEKFKIEKVTVDGTSDGVKNFVHPTPCCKTTGYSEKFHFYSNVKADAPVKFTFSVPVDKKSVSGNLTFHLMSVHGHNIDFEIFYKKKGCLMIIQPTVPLDTGKQYVVWLSTGLQSENEDTLQAPFNILLSKVHY